MAASSRAVTTTVTKKLVATNMRTARLDESIYHTLRTMVAVTRTPSVPYAVIVPRIHTFEHNRS